MKASKSIETIGHWTKRNKETKLDVIQDIASHAGVKSLCIGELTLAYIKKIRTKCSEGFECQLMRRTNKAEAHAELTKVFPDLAYRLSLVGMLDLIEVVNKCQKN